MHTFRVLDEQIGLVPAAIARTLIGKVLARLREEGVIEPSGTGRSARWRRR